MKVVVVVVAALTTIAQADPKADATAALKAHLAVFGDTDSPVFKTAVSYFDQGEEIPRTTDDLQLCYRLTGNCLGDVKFALTNPTIVVADKVAWFHTNATMNYTEQAGNDRPQKAQPLKLRLSGVLILDGTTWKVDRIAYSHAVADKSLMCCPSEDEAPTGKPSSHTGDEPIAKAVDAWFAGAGGFTKSASTDASTTANGTAPAEFASGSAAAQKLAKGWESLKLSPASVTAVSYGKVGFARVDVRMPVPAKKGGKPQGVKMTLNAILVDEGGTWKWRSINWSGR